MNELEDMDDEEEEDDPFLKLTLSLASHHDDRDCDRTTGRKRNINPDSSTSRGSSDGGDRDHHCCRDEILGLLQHREQMLIQENNQERIRDKVELDYIVDLVLKIKASIDEDNFSSAIAGLIKMYENASLAGQSVERATAYFADGLSARLLKGKPSFHDMIMKGPTPAQEFLAFTHLYRVSPCYQFSHFTANQAILEAFEKEQGRSHISGLHVLDFDLAYGLQWPSLMQSLSERATTANTVISLRIAGLARSLEELMETEARLVSFSKGFHNLVFEFHGLLRGSTSQIHNAMNRRENEALAVNSISCLHWSTNHTFMNTLLSIKSLHPSVVVLVRQGGQAPSSLMDSLHYYVAMFDSLDGCLPRDNPERVSIERNHLGEEMKKALADSSDHVDEGVRRAMEESGFCGIRLSSRTVMQAKLLLRMRSPNSPGSAEPDSSAGFRVCESEDGRAISLVWQHTEMVTASAWQPL